MAGRTLSLTYGAFTVGGASATSGTKLVGKIAVRKAYRRLVVEANALVQHDDAATFAGYCVAIEAAFSKPRQSLAVAVGGQTLISVSESANTGLDADPSIDKSEGPADTAKSRLYRVRVEVARPADLTGQSGRADSTVEVEESTTGRRTIRVSGLYTALGSNKAQAQFEASGPAYVAAAVAAFGGGGTYEVVSKSQTPNDTNSLCAFSWTYREILKGQSSAATDDPDLVEQRLNVGVARSSPGDSPGKAAKRPARVHVSYSVDVRRTVSSLRTKWTSIRSYVLAQAQARANLGTLVVVDEDVRYDEDTPAISAEIDCVALTGSNVLSYVKTQTTSTVPNDQLVPVHGASSVARLIFPGFETRTIALNETTRTVSASGSAPTDRSGGSKAPLGTAQSSLSSASTSSTSTNDSPGQNWRLRQDEETVVVTEQGLDAGTLVYTDRTRTRRWEYAEAAPAAAGSGRVETGTGLTNG